MSDRLTQLGSQTETVLITFTTTEHLGHYLARNELAYPTLIDADRHTYRAYGLGRGSFRRVWGWRAWLRYIEILRADGTADLARPVEDARQLGGDFVIAPDGTLAYTYRSEGPDDRPSVDELIDAVTSLSA